MHGNSLQTMKNTMRRQKYSKIEMQKGARVLGSVIGSETECKTSLETHLEEHNKKPGKIVKLSSQNVYSSWGTRKIIIFS